MVRLTNFNTNYELIDVSADGEAITITHWENNIPYTTGITYGGVGAVNQLWTSRLDYAQKYRIAYSPTGYQKDITFDYTETFIGVKLDTESLSTKPLFERGLSQLTAKTTAATKQIGYAAIMVSVISGLMVLGIGSYIFKRGR